MPDKNNINTNLPLSGLRVLDFGQFIAGPVCAALLADLGADVIRVERIGGNPDRYVTPLDKSLPDVGAMYAFANRNKRSIALNLTDASAREVFERLLMTSDAVVTNMSQRALQKLGLDLPALQRIKPTIVASNVTAYGNEGPWKMRTGFDGMAQAISGAMHMSGENGNPRKSYVHFVDFYAGAISAIGLLASLLQRQTKGVAVGVETSLLASAMMMMNSVFAEEGVLHPDRAGIGNRAHSGGPADTFETSDGTIILQVLGNAKFALLCKLIGHDELASDTRFATDNLRGHNADTLNPIVQAWCRSLTSEECVDRLTEAGLCAAPVLSPLQALDHPQIKQHSSLHKIHYPEADIHVPTFLPIEVDGERSAAAPAPQLGVHSNEILRELGYSTAEIDEFVKSGVTAIKP